MRFDLEDRTPTALQAGDVIELINNDELRIHRVGEDGAKINIYPIGDHDGLLRFAHVAGEKCFPSVIQFMAAALGLEVEYVGKWNNSGGPSSLHRTLKLVNRKPDSVYWFYTGDQEILQALVDHQVIDPSDLERLKKQSFKAPSDKFAVEEMREFMRESGIPVRVLTRIGDEGEEIIVKNFGN